MKQKLLRIGHRGGAGDKALSTAPENSLAAIQEGIGAGCDYVEVDIQRTLDGELVLMHDKRVDRTTGHKGRVACYTFAELRNFKLKGGDPIPRLSEVLELLELANGRVGLMAEIITPGIATQVASLVRDANLRSSVIFASFLHAELLAVRRVLPQAQTLALLEGVPVTGAQFALAAQASHVGLSFDSVTEAFVRELQASQLTVFVYTLDDPDDIQRARDLGVDGIISNYPGLI